MIEYAAMVTDRVECMYDDKSMTYQDAGVDIDAGNALVKTIKTLVKPTMRPEVLASIGGFAGLFELPLDRYQKPVLVSATDGVGTKLKLALQLGKHEGIGIDLVAMCVNDLIVYGAEPLFFLDYYATGHLNPQIAETVIRSIAEGCQLAGAALIGGETAELPGMYQGTDYDLAGFCVGIAEKDQLINGKQSIQAGDALIALASSGPHANGYSLIRKLIANRQVDLKQVLDGKSLAEHLLAPTRIYVKTILNLQKQIQIRGIAHITGGGILENLPRILPEETQAAITLSSWTVPSIFNWLQQLGNIEKTEMFRTFNCGVGMILCVSQTDVEPALALLKQTGEHAWAIGQITPSDQKTPSVQFIE